MYAAYRQMNPYITVLLHDRSCIEVLLRSALLDCQYPKTLLMYSEVLPMLRTVRALSGNHQYSIGMPSVNYQYTLKPIQSTGKNHTPQICHFSTALPKHSPTT